MLKGGLAIAIVVACASFASAQSPSLHVLADVPFAFTAGPDSFPAGTYDILRTSDTADVLELRNAKTEKAVIVPFVSRLAERGGTGALLVFDKDAKGTYLSEIHVAGDDGYILKGAPERHTHVIVKATRK